MHSMILVTRVLILYFLFKVSFSKPNRKFSGNDPMAGNFRMLRSGATLELSDLYVLLGHLGSSL